MVLTATDHRDLVRVQHASEFEPLWRQMQDELAVLSTNTVHHVVEGTTHSSLQTRDGAVTAAAIGQIVRAVRTGRPLASTGSVSQRLVTPSDNAG
jgi:hypothetical protein